MYTQNQGNVLAYQLHFTPVFSAVVPIICIQYVFPVSLGKTMVPRENKNNAYAKFEGGGTNKEYYGIYQSGVFVDFSLQWPQFRVLPG